MQRIDEEIRYAVKEVTLDLSDSMRKIVRTAFPEASRVIDRFHIQRLACDAVQELRIKHRWDAIQQANEEMEEAKRKNEDYVPYRYSNGDTRRELLILFSFSYLRFLPAVTFPPGNPPRSPVRPYGASRG